MNDYPAHPMRGRASTKALAFSIRPAKIYDIPAIAGVHRDSVNKLCASHYSAAQLEAWFQHRPPDMYVNATREQRVWVASCGQEVLGLLEIRPAEIEKLFVRSDSAGQGIGSALLGLGLERLRKAFTGTITALALLNARTFYERHGFVKVGESALLRGPRNIEISIARMQLFGIAEP